MDLAGKTVARKQSLRYFPGIFGYSRNSNTRFVYRYFFSIFQCIPDFEKPVKEQTGIVSAFSGIPDNRVRFIMHQITPALVRHVRPRWDTTILPVCYYQLVTLEARTCCELWPAAGTFLIVNEIRRKFFERERGVSQSSFVVRRRAVYVYIYVDTLMLKSRVPKRTGHTWTFSYAL